MLRPVDEADPSNGVRRECPHGWMRRPGEVPTTARFAWCAPRGGARSCRSARASAAVPLLFVRRTRRRPRPSVAYTHRVAISNSRLLALDEVHGLLLREQQLSHLLQPILKTAGDHAQ